MKILRLLIISIFLAISIASSVMAGGVIIVNRDNPIGDIHSSRLKKIYNGNIKLWDDRTKVVPVDLIYTHPMAIRFTYVIQGVNMETKSKFWIQKLFAGLGAPPHQEKDEKSVISFVSSEPGAIGYVDKESADSTVKIITVDGKEEF